MDRLIRLKAQELASYILGRRTALDFDKPRPNLNRSDSEAVRDPVLSLTAAEARKLGIRKNTLWYLQQRAQTRKPLRIYSKVRSMLPQDN